MTDAQLDAIEADLGVTLPAAYRAVSRAFPFRPLGRDWVYWFADTPDAVVNNTRDPHFDGDYAGPALLPRYVAVGQSYCGDLYLLDLAAGPDWPVVNLSHETHAIGPEWPTFAGFVAEWVQAHADYEQAEAARLAAATFWSRHENDPVWVLGGVAVFCTLLVAVMAAVAVAVR